jgi:hypothetical protein
MDKKAENKTEKKVDRTTTSGSGTSKNSEQNMNRTEFAQEYNFNTDKQSKNCNTNKANKTGNKNSGQK